MDKEVKTKKQYSIYKCRVHENNPLFAVLDEWAHLANNLYNETLFIIRQLFTSLSKDKKDMSTLESTTIDNVLEVLKSYGKGLTLNKDHRLVDYYFMDYYFKRTNNENYNSSLPKQSAQRAIKDACDSFNSWFKALKNYKKPLLSLQENPKCRNIEKVGVLIQLNLPIKTLFFINKNLVMKLNFLKQNIDFLFQIKLKVKN